MARKRDSAKALGQAVRPVAKAILKAGLSIYGAAEQSVAEAGERFMDLVAEAREEMNGAVKPKVRSKKAPSRKRRFED